MEKRLVMFCVLTAVILGSHMLVQSWLNPPKPDEVAQVDPAASPPDGDKPAEKEDEKPSEQIGPEGGAEESTSETPAKDKPSSEEPATTKPSSAAEQPRWVTLGSLDPSTGYRLLVTLSSRGAAVERIEVSSPQYRDLVDKTGYLGHLSLEDLSGGGAKIRVVGPGTPAATATPKESASGQGLQVDDVIRAVDGEPLADAKAWLERLANSRPGDKWQVDVERDGVKHAYELQLARQPLAILRPETQAASDPLEGNPPSCVFTLASIGADRNKLFARADGEDIPGIPALAAGHWELLQATPQLVEFRRVLDAKTLASAKVSGDLEIIRRYRLAPVAAEKQEDPDQPAYHVDMEIEVRTTSKKGIAVTGTLTGPNNLPIEGWWYTTKISGGWSSCGARDVVMLTDGGGKQLVSCQEILTAAGDKEKRTRPLFAAGEPDAVRTVRFLGVDAQYFAAVLLPKSEGPNAPAPMFRSATAVAVGDAASVPKGRNRTLNVSFQLTTEQQVVKADEPWLQHYVLFAGPKHPDLLAQYGEQTEKGSFDLNSLLEYGWFGWVARPLSRIVHWIHAVVANYGISIILLTVLVRSCMLPISHKAAKNTQKMQLLAPEMKKIAELYKNDMEKRGRAQQELYRKYDVNPFSGCLLALCQLPIFIGLYRCLSVDIELRQASLIPGAEWASNLAGPDMLWYWKNYLPEFLVDETGYLGPYFNLLPLLTIGLFLFNQKMLTPPATDDQTRMQHNVMMVTTVIFGVMFFKVPAGLCIYFISSSIWSLTEHKLLRKKPATGSATPATAPTPTAPPKPSGSPVRKVNKPK